MADIRSHAFSMFLAAAVFAVIGYYMYTWQYATATPAMVLLLKWTLRVGSIIFAIAGALAALRLIPGLVLYGVSGISSAAICVAVALWEMNSTYHSGPGPLILIVLAAWTGYTGIDALRHLKAAPPQQVPAP